jgi:HAD superfamily hydrolase (TIGR01509 family)
VVAFVVYSPKAVSDGFDLVLFDLGGVLIGLGGGVSAMQRLAGIETPEEVWRRWLSCEWVREFERGTCEPDDFARGVVSDWELTITPEEFLEQFRAWPEDLFDGARELLDELRGSVAIGCLSNTNALHWADHGARWSLDQCFDQKFLSFQLGLVKPDREIFEHVCKETSLEPERIVFIDDNILNVEQARALGFEARVARGPDDARRALVELGFLTGR